MITTSMLKYEQAFYEALKHMKKGYANKHVKAKTKQTKIRVF